MNNTRIALAEQLADDLVLLRATAGVPISGPLDIAFLKSVVERCGGGADCPSCAALEAVIATHPALAEGGAQ